MRVQGHGARHVARHSKSAPSTPPRERLAQRGHARGRLRAPRHDRAVACGPVRAVTQSVQARAERGVRRGGPPGRAGSRGRTARRCPARRSPGRGAGRFGASTERWGGHRSALHRPRPGSEIDLRQRRGDAHLARGDPTCRSASRAEARAERPPALGPSASRVPRARVRTRGRSFGAPEPKVRAKRRDHERRAPRRGRRPGRAGGSGRRPDPRAERFRDRRAGGARDPGLAPSAAQHAARAVERGPARSHGRPRRLSAPDGGRQPGRRLHAFRRTSSELAAGAESRARGPRRPRRGAPPPSDQGNPDGDRPRHGPRTRQRAQACSRPRRSPGCALHGPGPSRLDPHAAHLARRMAEGCEDAVAWFARGAGPRPRRHPAPGAAPQGPAAHEAGLPHGAQAARPPRRRPRPPRSRRRRCPPPRRSAPDARAARGGAARARGRRGFPHPAGRRGGSGRRPCAPVHDARAPRLASSPTRATPTPVAPSRLGSPRRGAAASQSMKTFAAGLEHDGAAVRAALTTPWSDGQAEGRIDRLKLIKRRSHGRAGFALPRRRVLHAPDPHETTKNHRAGAGARPLGPRRSPGAWAEVLGRRPGQNWRGRRTRVAHKVVALVEEEGPSHRAVARRLDLSKNTVSAIMKRHRAAGSGPALRAWSQNRRRALLPYDQARSDARRADPEELVGFEVGVRESAHELARAARSTRSARGLADLPPPRDRRARRRRGVLEARGGVPLRPPPAPLGARGRRPTSSTRSRSRSSRA